MRSSISRGVSVTTQDPINAATRFCAVFGQPIRHSASPAMHNPAIAAAGLNWRYVAFEVAPSRLAEAIAGCKAMKMVGVNLTVPHKLLALDLMDELDATARDWGAVNTIRFDAREPGGEWRPIRDFSAEIPDEIRGVGFNTDADAVVRSVEEDLGLVASGLKVLVLGEGGAGRVAALRLASAGAAEVYLQNRTVSKAAEVQREIMKRYPASRSHLGYPPGKVDLVINATSLGLKPSDVLPIDLQEFPLQRAGAVYDMIYRPAETPLLALARQAGCRTANGLGMLLYQGARAFEIWSGIPAPIPVMRAALMKHIYG